LSDSSKPQGSGALFRSAHRSPDSSYL